MRRLGDVRGGCDSRFPVDSRENFKGRCCLDGTITGVEEERKGRLHWGYWIQAPTLMRSKP